LAGGARSQLEAIITRSASGVDATKTARDVATGCAGWTGQIVAWAAVGAGCTRDTHVAVRGAGVTAPRV
jgi:hypothetical protein